MWVSLSPGEWRRGGEREPDVQEIRGKGSEEGNAWKEIKINYVITARKYEQKRSQIRANSGTVQKDFLEKENIFVKDSWGWHKREMNMNVCIVFPSATLPRWHTCTPCGATQLVIIQCFQLGTIPQKSQPIHLWSRGDETRRLAVSCSTDFTHLIQLYCNQLICRDEGEYKTTSLSKRA